MLPHKSHPPQRLTESRPMNTTYTAAATRIRTVKNLAKDGVAEVCRLCGVEYLGAQEAIYTSLSNQITVEDQVLWTLLHFRSNRRSQLRFNARRKAQGRAPVAAVMSRTTWAEAVKLTANANVPIAA